MPPKLFLIFTLLFLPSCCKQLSTPTASTSEPQIISAASTTQSPTTQPTLLLVITLDSQRLTALGLTTDEVFRALQIYAPKIAQPQLTPDHTLNPRFLLPANSDPAALAQIVIKFINGSPVRLSTVATFQTTTFPPGDLPP